MRCGFEDEVVRLVLIPGCACRGLGCHPGRRWARRARRRAERPVPAAVVGHYAV